MVAGIFVQVRTVQVTTGKMKEKRREQEPTTNTCMQFYKNILILLLPSIVPTLSLPSTCRTIWYSIDTENTPCTTGDLF